MQRTTRTTLTALGALAMSVSFAYATPSGLNNIPTADTAPDLTPVIQVFSTWGAERKPDHSAGMKIGFGPWGEGALWNSRFEAGVDGHYAPGDAGPAVFQLKYALQPWERGPAIAVGAANMAVTESDRARGGQPFSYLVLSHDFKHFRLHGGYGVQHNGGGALLGIDRTFEFLARPLTLRADATQIQNESQWLTSVGAVYAFTPWLIMETWGSIPVETGEPTYTLKFNFVLDWKKYRK